MRLLLSTEETDTAGFAGVYGALALPVSADPGRPFVAVDMAMTLDGKVVAGGPPGQALSGSRGDRRVLEELRAAADAVVMGAGTVRASDPVLQLRSPDLLAGRSERRQAPQPLCVVVTKSGHLNPESRMFHVHPERTVVLTSQAGEAALRPLVPPSVRVAALSAGTLDPAAILRFAAGDLGVQTLLLEGGPTLTAAFLEAGCIDELFITVAPLVRGGKDELTLVEGNPFPAGTLPRLQLLEMREDRSELYLRYRVIRS